MADLFQINKLSHLHDGKKIIFCKTDYLIQEFENIKKLDNNVILISGNSDYPITDEYLKFVPKNIIKWFGQNILSNNSLFEPIPIGIENKNECFRHGHGIGYYNSSSKKELLIEKKTLPSYSEKIYSNFRIDTNFYHRNTVRQLCIQSDHIDWDEPNLSIEEFFLKISKYEMIICPSGNGIDTHRLWEVMYSDRIPITIKMGDYKIYDLYKKLPIIILDKVEDLKNKNLIYDKLSDIKNQNYNLDVLECSYWINEIKKYL